MLIDECVLCLFFFSGLEGCFSRELKGRLKVGGGGFCLSPIANEWERVS